jgi:mycothiol synthase
VSEPLVRAPLPAEAEAIADVLNAHSMAVLGTPEVTAGEIRSWFELPGLDAAHDMVVAVAAGGTLVGYADVGGGHEPGEPLWIDLRVPPQNPTAAERLLEAMETRARERGAPARPVRAVVFEPDTDAHALFQAAGYRRIRSSYHMERALDEAPEPPRWPDGLRPRSFVPRVDDELVYEAHMDAFADHWSFHRQPYDEWRHWGFPDGFDPELWFLVEDGPEIAGICLCLPHEPAQQDLGWVYVLGVRPPWRRRGLARALLLHAFRELHARGRARVGLGVDAENTTGAVRLYESVGMHVHRRSDTYEKAA